MTSVGQGLGLVPLGARLLEGELSLKNQTKAVKTQPWFSVPVAMHRNELESLPQAHTLWALALGV